MSSAKSLYRVTYTDDSDDGCPEFTYRVRAYNREHVETMFYESPTSDGWKIVRVERVAEVRP